MFEAVLNQAMAMLQRQGRVSYRALKRQFALDDDYLADLKEAILYAYPQVVDDGRGLVWMSSPGTASEPVPRTPQAVLQHDTQDPQSSQTALSPLVEPPIPEAERRQLTVMFCDLVGSTPLSEQLDPEDLLNVIRVYQQTCAEVVQRYDGHIAQLLGDALLVYFGWPQAHEDDAQRAARTGLGMLEAMGRLNSRLESHYGLRLAIRVGIHTGLVVVGKMGGSGHQERLALGDTPNIASRLQELANPGTVIISEATYRLIEGYFICQALGAQTFRGVARPMPVYCVLRESGVQSRVDIVTPRGLTPLVGREQEVSLLIAQWEQAKGGMGRVVLLCGEGGIGKSRLVRVLKDHVADEPHTRLECRSSPYYQNTALYPMIDLMERALQFQRDDTPEDKLEKLERTLRQFRLILEETVPLFARLLSLPIPKTRYPPRVLTPQRQRQKTLEIILAIVLEQAARHPVLFILEDLHWTDPTTLALLDLLIEQAPTAAILILLTFRPTFQPTWHMHPSMTQMVLNRLSRQQAAQMVEQAAGGKMFPQDVVRQIVAKTDGVPLFVEEFTKMVLESGLVQETHDQDKLSGSLPALAIPSTLHDSLMARLDRLVAAKGIAQVGAVIGRQFSWELLQAVSQLDETTLQSELNRLVDAELLHYRGIPPHVTYTFKHALIRDAAYESLLKSTRQQYHQQIAQILVDHFPETAAIQPELLAHHYTEGGLAALAIPYWQQAGQRAMERSSNEEAVGFLTTGLQLLKTLPETPERIQQELHLQTTLGPALMATCGYAAPVVEEAYAQARELCQQKGETSQILAVMQGLFSFYIVRGQIRIGYELGEQFLHLAQCQPDTGPLLMAYRSLGTALYQLGELHSAYAHCQQAIALYKPQQHHTLAFRSGQDPGVACRSYAAWALCLLGYLDQARENNSDALALAEEYTHAHTLVWSLGFSASFHQLRREGQAAQEHAETAIALSSEHGFPIWTAWGTILRGWALAEQGQEEEGIEHMRQGMAAWQVTGAGLWWPHFLAMLAESYGKMGQAEAGLALLAEAIDVIHLTDERYYETEIYRLKGDLLLIQSSPDALQAETCFHQALEIARHQQAKFLELRTAVSLCRLWQKQGKQTEARRLLVEIYDWFTEGFDTVDLQEAKTLLAELG